MIIDTSRIISGVSTSRMSEYLSLCKIDCLVRKVDYSTPSRRADHPSKVGQAGTMAKPKRTASSRNSVKIDHDLKLGSRERTLTLKRELSKQSGLIIKSLTEAGTVILQQGDGDTMKLPLYTVTSSADNFANKECKEWSFCLVVNKQDRWVDNFSKVLGSYRLEVDIILNVDGSQMKYRKVPKVKGGS